MNQLVNGIVIKRACSFKPDQDSTESKSVTLAIKFNSITLQDVFAKAAASSAIVWQNGYARKNFAKIKDKSEVSIDFKAPATVHIDPETAMIGKMASMSKAERLAYIAELEAKAAEMDEVTEE